MNNSTGRNNSTENKLRQFVLSGSYGGGFAIDLLRQANYWRMSVRLKTSFIFSSVIG